LATREQRRREYLAQAEQAEELAAKTKDTDIRDKWLKMAEAYRQLSKTT
jgi:hypothetical protein